MEDDQVEETSSAMAESSGLPWQITRSAMAEVAGKIGTYSGFLGITCFFSRRNRWKLMLV
jgi:hypothetical protein